MMTWLEVSSGVIAKTGAIKTRLKINAKPRSMRTLLLDNLDFVTQELRQSRVSYRN